MATTPPPPARLHTPPTPLHGPKYDSYEPYSPRRSGRLSAKREQHSFTEKVEPALGASQYAATPGRRHVPSKSTPLKRATIKRNSSQTFSPPSSPLYPDDATGSSAVDKSTSVGTPSQRSLYATGHGPGYDGYGIPTPSKTPKKRGNLDMRPTARVLFPGRSGGVDDVMPLKRSRKHKSTFAMDGFEDDIAEDIPIYTDSKDRVPDEDDDEENPFVSRNGVSSRSVPNRARNGTKYGMTKEIDDMVDNGEGYVYVFRGRKIFQRITDADRVEKVGESGPLEVDASIRRSAGARKALPRTNLRPRRLFQPAQGPLEADEADEEADEEAVTDIEPEPSGIAPEPEAATPVKNSFAPATPPSTVRKETTHTSPMWLDGADERGDAKASRSSNNPFDTWRRTKPGPGKRARPAVDEAGEKVASASEKGKRSKVGN